jgi:hypothetical protein
MPYYFEAQEADALPRQASAKRLRGVILSRKKPFAQ